MSTTVYLIGHGRVDAAVPITLPPNVTMHWLGPLGDVTAGLSHHFLNGALTQEDSTSAPGSSIAMHYLCGEHADADDVVTLKIRNFFSRQTPHPHGSRDPYFLYPRGKINVSLSSIFDFLTMLSPSIDWHVYWTCCRGYIGQKNPYATIFNKEKRKVERKRRENPDETPPLNAQEHETTLASFETVRLVASSDQAAIQEEMKEQRVLPSETIAIEGILRV